MEEADLAVFAGIEQAIDEVARQLAVEVVVHRQEGLDSLGLHRSSSTGVAHDASSIRPGSGATTYYAGELEASAGAAHQADSTIVVGGVLGLLNNALYLGATFWALRTIRPELVVVVVSCAPFMTALIAAALGLERLALLKVVGIALGFIGVLVISGVASTAPPDPFGVARQAHRNIQNNVITDSQVTLLSAAGDLLMPVADENLALDLIYENLPNIPLGTDDSLGVGQTSSTFQ